MEEARPGWWRRRVVAVVVAQLKQGFEPAGIALTIALGIVLGLFPILGATTVLCALAALWLKLNQALIQSVNYLIAPLQVLLLLPFYRAGESLFQRTPVPIFDLSELVDRFWAGPLRFVIDYGMVGLYGIVVWALIAAPLAAALYFMLKAPIAGMALRLRSHPLA